MSKSSNAILGLLAGTAIGAALGVLFAPEKGSKTRRKIKDEANNFKGKVERDFNELKNDFSDKLSGKRATLEREVDNFLSDVTYKSEDVITALEKKLADLKEKNAKLQKK